MEKNWIFNDAPSFNKLWFNDVFSRDNLPKTIKDGAYIINLDEYADVSTHWVALFCNRSEIVYFDSFGVEHVPDKIKEFIGNKNIKATIFLVQTNKSIMCGCFCIRFIDFSFIDFMLAKNRLMLQTCSLLMTLKRIMI